MEKNINQTDVSEWVDERMGSLAGTPVPEIDAAIALNRFGENWSVSKRRRSARMWTMLAAVAVFCFLLTLPLTRGFAQRLWNRVFLIGGTVVLRTSQFEPTPKEADYSW